MYLLFDEGMRVELSEPALLVFSSPLAGGNLPEPRLSSLAAICAPREVAMSRA